MRKITAISKNGDLILEPMEAKSKHYSKKAAYVSGSKPSYFLHIDTAAMPVFSELHLTAFPRYKEAQCIANAINEFYKKNYLKKTNLKRTAP